MRDEVILVSSERFKGDIYVVSTGNLKLIGAEARKSIRIPLETEFPRDSSVRKAYLEISATTSEEPQYVRWRLWLDGLQLAREYKPVMCQELGDGRYYSKIIYDITPVFKHSQRLHNVNISYEGFRELLIDHLSLILPYETVDAETSYTYLSTSKILDFGEKCKIEFTLPDLESEELGEMKMSCIFPSKSAKLSIGLNGELIEVYEGICNLGELEISNIPYKPSTNILEIAHVTGSMNYYPRHFKLSNIIFKVSKYKLPKLKIENLTVEDGRLKFKIINLGESIPDKTIAILMSASDVHSRVVIRELGREEDVELPIPKKLKPGTKATLRVIWRKLNQTCTIDRELSF